MTDVRQEFELTMGTGRLVSDLSEECVRMIRNAVPFAGAPHEAYLTATGRTDGGQLPRDTYDQLPMVIPCSVCEMGVSAPTRHSKQGKPVQVICNSCLDNEVCCDPRGVRAAISRAPEIVPDQGGILAEIRQLIDDYADRDFMADKYPFPIGFVPISLLSPLIERLTKQKESQ